MTITTLLLGFFIPAVVSIFVFFVTTAILGLSTLVGAVFGGFSMFWGFKLASEYALNEQKKDKRQRKPNYSNQHKEALREIAKIKNRPRPRSRVRDPERKVRGADRRVENRGNSNGPDRRVVRDRRR